MVDELYRKRSISFA